MPDSLAQIIAYLSGAIVIFSFIGYLYRFFKNSKKPIDAMKRWQDETDKWKEKQEEKMLVIRDIKEDVKRHDQEIKDMQVEQTVSEDKMRSIGISLEHQETINNVELKTLSALVDHAIDGNTKKLEQVAKELDEIFIRKTGSIK